MEYNLKDVYNAIKGNGDFKSTKSYADFASKMNYKGYQTQIFNMLKQGGANVGSGPDEFRRHLGLKSIDVNAVKRQKKAAYQSMQGDGKGTMLSRDYYPGGRIAGASPLIEAADETRKYIQNSDYSKPAKAPKVAEVAQKSNQLAGLAGVAAANDAQQAGNEPIIDEGNANVNKYFIRTQRQQQEEMDRMSDQLIGTEANDFIKNSIGDEFKAAKQRYSNRFNSSKGLDKYMPADVSDWNEAFKAQQANRELDQDAMLKDLANTVGKNIEKWAGAPSTKAALESDARRLGISPKDYLDKVVAPKLKERIAGEFAAADLERYMPKSKAEYIIGGIMDSTLGNLDLLLTNTKKQRQLREQAMQATNEGLNKRYTPGTWEKAARGTVAFAADAPLYALGGAGAEAGTARLMGNGIQTAARMANTTVAGRIGMLMGRGAVHGGITGGIVGGIGGAVQNWSTGEDTSLAGYAKAIASGSAHEAASFATMEGLGGIVGGLGSKIGITGTEKSVGKTILHGAEKLGYGAFKTGTEGIGMAAGGWVANTLSNTGAYATGQIDEKEFNERIKNVVTVEGTLESCASAVLFKLMHVKDAFKGGTPGKERPLKELPKDILSNIKSNVSTYFISDATKNSHFTFSNDDISSLRASGKRNGMDEFEKFKDWAKATKKEPEGSSENNAEYVGTYYKSIMEDPNVSWDTKAKFSAYVMGVMPGARPLADYHTFTFENLNGDGKTWSGYVNEYSAKGELLSKKSYKNKEERDRIWDENKANADNYRLQNAWSVMYLSDMNDKGIRKEFMLFEGWDESKTAEESEKNKAIADGMKDPKSEIYKRFDAFVQRKGRTARVLEETAANNGLTVNELVAAFNKDPLKRTAQEANALYEMRRRIEKEMFPEEKVHTEQSAQEGREAAVENGLGGEQPDDELVKGQLAELKKAEDELGKALQENDVFNQVYNKMKEQGLRNDQIYEALIDAGLTEDDLAPLAKYINVNAKVQGMMDGTRKNIEEGVSRRVDERAYIGTMNGEKQEKQNVVYVTDKDGRQLVVTSGDMAFDENGRPKEDVGDMLMCVDENTGDVVRVSVKDVTFSGVKPSEEYANEYRTLLQQRNSVAYAEAQQEQNPENGGDKAPQESISPTEEKGTENSGKIEIPEQNYSLSEKKAGNGEQFYQDESGNIDLAQIPDEVFDSIGYTKAPFRLTPSMIQHMLARHNKELGFKNENEAIRFVRDVMTNFDHVRLGNDGALVFSIENGRNRTGKRAITILINSDNGEFYGLKTSGYEAIKCLEKRPLLWERGAKNESSSTDAASASVPTSKSSISGEQSGSASHQSIGLESKDTNKSSNGNGNNTTLTFKDGTPVPMTKDSKGRPTADYSKMTPEQGAEYLTSTFGDDAEKVVDGKIKRAEAAVKKAEKVKVDYTADDADILDAEKAKKEAVETARKELDLYTDIKKAMTAKKVSENVDDERGNVPQEQPQTEAQNEAVRKFMEAPKVEGRRGSITLPNGEKIKGRYVAVPAMSLVPSHDPFNGYKPHEGAPLDANGHTVNDRDYATDKDAQQVTDAMGRDYGGQAISDIPVVNPDGRVVSGNGRTMAGQLAAKNGTDGKYVEARNENAEGFGMKAEDLDKLDHARIVFIPDEPLPYDSATFAKFNRSREKSQSNTQQAISISKKLSSDEVGAIVSEIDGQGSLDAFFNNPKAINDLVKTLVQKGIVGQNEVAALLDAGGERLSPQGKEFVKNLLLGGIFKEETISMMGIDSQLKNKVVNGIRSVMENMKLGEYSLRDEIDNAIQLLYNAKRSKMNVSDYLRQNDAFDESAREKYSQVAQALAQALEGNTALFRDLMREYNDVAKVRSTGESDMFGENLSREELVKQFLEISKIIKENDIKLYGKDERLKEGEGGNHAASDEEPAKETGGGNGEEKPAETRQQVEIVDEAGYDAAVGRLKTADGNERERILDSMEAYVKEYARKNGYDEPVIFRTKQDMADAAKTEEGKKVIEDLPEDSHFPGYYEDGKIHICLEHSTGSKELKETFEHESVHADNANDPSRVEMLVAAVEETRELTRRELESVVEGLSHSTYYTDLASKMKDADAIRMLADEALAHLVTHAYKNGVESMSEITDNPTLLNIAKQTFKERENDRRRKERHAASGDKGQERPNIDALSTEEDGSSMGSGQKGKSGNVGRGSHGEDVSNNKGTKEGISDPAEGLEDAASKFKAEQMKRNGQQKEQTPEEKAAARAKDMEENPLTKEEIDSYDTGDAESDEYARQQAQSYLDGNKNPQSTLFYNLVYDNVRNRRQDGEGDSVPADTPHMDGGDDAAAGSGRDGGTAGQVDNGQGGADVPGRENGGESRPSGPAVSDGEGGNQPVGGEASSVEGVSSRSGRPGRGGNAGGTRPAGGKRGAAPKGGEGAGGNKPSAQADFDAAANRLKDLLDQFRKAGKKNDGTLKATVNPLDIIPIVNKMMPKNAEQAKLYPKILKAFGDAAYNGLRLFGEKIERWFEGMRNNFGGTIRGTFPDLTDEEVDRYIHSLWDTDYTFEGKRQTIGKWAEEIGREKLRAALSITLDEKRRAQKEAESVAVKVGDRDNIAETLPFLLPDQQEDVMKAETQFFDPSHADDEHGGGNGMLFTNGTGTGKTYTGLGIAKRFIKQGKGRVLIVTPSQEKVTDWTEDAKNLGITLHPLVSKNGKGAKEDKGEGAVITTFANFRDNRALMEDTFDLVIYDESHKLMESKNATETSTTTAHYRLTNKDFTHAQERLMMAHPLWREPERLLKEMKPLLHGSETIDEASLNSDVTDTELQRLREIGARLQEIEREQEKAMPEINKKARESVGKTKVLFLSATPFNMRENLEYAEGYLFKYNMPELPEGASAEEYAKARNKARNAFYRKWFPHGEVIGSSGRVEPAVTDADKLDAEERSFADAMMEKGVMSGRTIDNGYDYSRDFPTVSVSHANEFNTALREMSETKIFGDFVKDIFGDYNTMSVLYETMKVAAIRDRLNEHLKRGRKVVVFHRRVNDNMGLARPPFAAVLKYAEDRAAELYRQNGQQSISAANAIMEEVKKFRDKYADLLQWEQTLDYRMPRQQLRSLFGDAHDYTPEEMAELNKRRAEYIDAAFGGRTDPYEAGRKYGEACFDPEDADVVKQYAPHEMTDEEALMFGARKPSKKEFDARKKKYAQTAEAVRKGITDAINERIANGEIKVETDEKGNRVRHVGLFAGADSKGQKHSDIETFNDDDSSMNIIVVQEASGKEGISLHDRTGKHQRVMVNLALPQSPIAFIQAEGRIYRIGQKSNAIFEYPLLGIDNEIALFAGKFNGRAATMENLALGSMARGLKDSIMRGVRTKTGNVPLDGQGYGGREFDMRDDKRKKGYDAAVEDYNTSAHSQDENIDDMGTPEPLGYKMVEWAEMKDGENTLEPSAGRGNVSRYIPSDISSLSIEPDLNKSNDLMLLTGGVRRGTQEAQGRKTQVMNGKFEDLSVMNKFDTVVMNSPNGAEGATAKAHMEKAVLHLNDSGRLVAVVPDTESMNKFVDELVAGNTALHLSGEIKLPACAYSAGGVSQKAKVVVIDKLTRKEVRDKWKDTERVDLSDATDMEDFFKKLKGVKMPERVLDPAAKDMKYANRARASLVNLKGFKSARAYLYADDKAISIKPAGRFFNKMGYVMPVKDERGNTRYARPVYLWRYDYDKVKKLDNNVLTQYHFCNEVLKMSDEEIAENIFSGANDNEKSVFANDLREYCTAVSKMIRGISGRTDSELERSYNGEDIDIVLPMTAGTKLSMDDVRAVFDSNNKGNEELGHLFDKVFGVAKDLGLKVSVFDDENTRTAAFYRNDNTLQINAHFWNAKKMVDEKTGRVVDMTGEVRASVLTHELIHSVTAYANYWYDRDPERLPEPLRKAAEELDNLYRKIIGSSESWRLPSYCKENKNELIAEMANPAVREPLKKMGFWSRLVDGVKKFFNISQKNAVVDGGFASADEFERNSAYNDLATVLDKFLNHFDKDSYDAFVAMSGAGRHNKEVDVVDEKGNKNGDRDRKSDELFLSLQNKKGKEYYDTVTELARRVAEGRESSSESSFAKNYQERGLSERDTQRDGGGRHENIRLVPSAIRIIAQERRRTLEENGREDRARPTGEREGNFLSNVGSNGYYGKDEKIRDEIDRTILEWAKDNGFYISEDDVRKNSHNGNFYGRGSEARVYLSKDKKTITKFVKYSQLQRDDMGDYVNFVDRYNIVFPETAYQIVGVSRDKAGVARVVVEQPYIEGEPLSFKEWRENQDKYNGIIEQMMEQKGFAPEGDGTSFFNKDLYVSDVHYRNVLYKDGKPIVVDANVRPRSDIEKWENEMLDGYVADWENALADLKDYRKSADRQEWEEIDKLLAEINKRTDLAKSSQDTTHFRVATSMDGAGRPQTEGVVEYHVQRMSDKLGVHVNMIGDVEDIPDPRVKADVKAGKNVTGWFDEKTGKVYLYMPNVRDTYTAEKTIWHEVVGHRGLRGLFGDDFNKFMRSLWYDIDSPINKELKAYVQERMAKDPLSFYDAIEEYLADAAEKGRGERGFWNNIKNKMVDIMHEIGYRIAPNVKDVKYLLWLSKNLQKHPDDPVWRMRADAVRYKIERERVPEMAEYGGMFYDNEGKAYTAEDVDKKTFEENTDGLIHFRTTPSAATALDFYQKALSTHGYMFTEAHMDNMLALQKLMLAYMPKGTKIEDIDSNENPYMLYNTMQSKMSEAANMFERNVMAPLTSTVAKILDSIEGKNSIEKLRNFNLYLIKKHGLERNRAFFVRDAINEMRNKKDDAGADALQDAWNSEKKQLGEDLRNGKITLKDYYEQMDEWIRSNVEPSFVAGEHDASGFHGLYELGDKDPYDDAQVIDEVMNTEEAMENAHKGSVKDLWSKIHAATSFAIYSDYKNGISSREMYTHTSQMFDWYVPLRKYDTQMAEDVYGYVTQNGDPGTFLGQTIMKASGRKSLSNVNVLAQVGAMANSAIFNGGNNQIKQAFARFIRNRYDQDADNRLVTECNVWLEKKGVDAQGNDIWEEVFPNIKPEYTPKKISQVVRDFEEDMKAKQAQGLAKNMSSGGRIPFKFNRAQNKSEHIVTVSIAGKKHNFIINANPRAAQAINGLLENNKNLSGWAKSAIRVTSSVTRFMAQACTSFNPEFVVRNLVKDFEFSNLNLLAKEGARYTGIFEKYYLGLLPFVGTKGLRTINKSNLLEDFKGSDGVGLFAKYRRGELNMNNKTERYFKEFMENGGETGFVQMRNMKDFEKKYNLDILGKRSDVKKVGQAVNDFIMGGIENLNEVAENIARFSTYCASRESGRSIVRSVYDAKEVTANFNRKGSGSAISSFKNGDTGAWKNFRKNAYGFAAWYCRNFVMFYNAGIQSTNMLAKNFKKAPIGTTACIASFPFAMGLLVPIINQLIVGNEDEKKRNGVKDPYLELPDYVRRNNLCIYRGNGKFVTIPLAIETRAFYGLGDLASQMYHGTAQGDWGDHTREAVGQMTQLFPSLDYLGQKDFSKDPLTETAANFAPTVLVPSIEWWRNKDWKGARIERRDAWSTYDPAWERASTGVYPMLIDVNKKVNAKTNDVDPGNPEMLGNKILDSMTNPSMWQHYFGGFGGGAATFTGKAINYAQKKVNGEEVEDKDIPFIRSFFYEPSEGTSIQRTKTKWYNYVEDLGQAKANIDKLKKRSPDPEESMHNAAALFRYRESKAYQQVEIMNTAQKEMKRIDKIRKKTTDVEMVKEYNDQKDRIMSDAVNQLDRLN